jgi:hypothetical protein
MRSQRRFLFVLLAVVLVTLLLIVFSPALVAKGLRVWLWWNARAEKLTLKVDNIDAPFLRPIVLRGIHLKSADDAAVRIEANATQAVVSLNLKSILLRSRGRALENLSVEGLRAEIHRQKSGRPISDSGWSTLRRVLPENFAFMPFDLRFESGSALLLLRGVSISGSPVEAGRFHASEVIVSSSLFHQTFSNLSGATDWQAERLTLAGLTLTRGLDAQSITFDSSHLGKRRLAFDVDLDVFGGKFRGSIANEWRSQHSNWSMAGSAADISLSQTAEAIGFMGRVGGLVHAGKFTFRGDLADPLAATASLWMELTAPAWRDREADLVMLGLSLYARQLELQQLYIKQKKNQLTLSGESSFPTTPSGWLRPDFRGNVSASIEDLGEFASLFGGDRTHFAGRIAVEGTLNARDRNIGGNLSASGSGLTMFKSSIDEFRAELTLKRNEVEITQLEMKRKNDLLQAQLKIATSPDYAYSGSIDATVSNVGEYLSLIYTGIQSKPISASLHATIESSLWDAHVILNPPSSRPVTVDAVFPFPLGKPWETLWTKPITITADFPALHLAEIPHRTSSSPSFDGILMGHLAITETPMHPKIIGAMQLLGGRFGSTPKSSEIEGRWRFDGHTGEVEFLKLGEKGNVASFYGNVDYPDSRQITMRLFPNERIVDLNVVRMGCISRIALTPASQDSLAPAVFSVELRGGIGSSDWTVSLREPFAVPASAALIWDFTSKSFQLCPGAAGSQEELVMGVEAPSPPPPAKARKRRR